MSLSHNQGTGCGVDLELSQTSSSLWQGSLPTIAAMLGSLPRDVSQPLQNSHELSPQPSETETFYGFIKDVSDASLLIEACIAGHYKIMQDLPYGVTTLPIRSGSCIVFAESSAKSLRVRWRDGSLWSCSRICGPFLLYREVVCTKDGETRGIQEKERKNTFTVTSARPNSKIVPNGLAKRTISMNGSDGNKYRVISYFYPKDVASYYERNQKESLLFTPSKLPEFQPFVDRAQVTLPSESPSIAPPIIPSSATLFQQDHSLSITLPSFQPSPPHRDSPTTVSSSSPTMEYYKPEERLPASRSLITHPYLRENNTSCPCGGLTGRRKQFDPSWINSPVYLSPLRRVQLE
ncbi:Gti1/Pac2 family-domain-containing protein [Obelidium mucronatum]|nr:Gti1/Pac2 family-domain-containing protein [Obelidium mucronatum]